MRKYLRPFIPRFIRAAGPGLSRRLHYLWEYRNGGEAWAGFLIRSLERYYHSKWKRDWKYGDSLPHHSNHESTFFRFCFTGDKVSPANFYRAFYVCEFLRPSDKVLDIGCGDGFLTSRFYASRCSQVDGVDLEASAIETAREKNQADNVNYSIVNAITDPLPRSRYDVVVLDGALGHFSAQSLDKLLNKISDAMGPNGTFVGSEEIGNHSFDHLSFFHSLDDLAAILRPHFKYIYLKKAAYRIEDGSIREEAFWRCSQSTERLTLEWENYSIAKSAPKYEGSPTAHA